MTKDEFTKKLMKPLPEALMNKGKLPIRTNIFYAITGWLLMDWFTKKVCFEPFVYEGEHYFRVVQKRWGQDLSFVLSPGGCIGLAMAMRNKDFSKLARGWTLTTEMLGTFSVPAWAWTGFVTEFADVLKNIQTVVEEAQKDLPDDSTTIH